MYYTHHMHFFIDRALYIWMNYNECIPGAHLRGPLTRPDQRADLLNTGVDVQSPECWAQRSGPVHKPPRLELKLVLVKRLIVRPWRPTCLMSKAMHTVFWGDVSPYSITSVHVAISKVGKRCRLHFHYTLSLRNLTLPSLFHSPSRFYFEYSALFLPQTHFLASLHQSHQGAFLSCNCF